MAGKPVRNEKSWKFSSTPQSTRIYQGVLLLWFLTLAAFSIFPSTFLQRGEMEEVKLALAVKVYLRLLLMK